MELIKKTLKELSWYLSPGARNYILCFIFIAQFQVRTYWFIQTI